MVSIKKNIIITGCSSGIGYASARILRGRGWRVFATARKSGDVQRLLDEGFESLPLDLADSDSIKGAVARVLSATDGQLGALFNNGAYGQPGAMEDVSREVLRRQFETNLFGTHELTRLVLPVMRRQGGGRVVQNSSILGFVALPYRGSYVASKFALEGLTQAMRLEMQGTGIHFSMIQPGPVNTPFRTNARKAFFEAVDFDNSLHVEKYGRWMQEDEGEGSSGGFFSVTPDVVVKKLIHALESPRPRLRYGVTFPTHAASFLQRIMTKKMLERLLMMG